MRRITQAAIALTLMGQSVVGWGNPWDKDMVDQPIAKAQRSVAPAGPDGIPVVGGETLPAPTTEAGMFEAKDEAVTLQNRVPATPESVATGPYLFYLNYLVFHGVDGPGDGAVGLQPEVCP